jgi:hypothetical protein
MAKELEQDRQSEDLGPDLEVGHDPHGDADPGSCGASPDECEMTPHEFDAPPERSEIPILEEMMESFVPHQTVFGTDPEDGLPVPLNEDSSLHEAPPFRYDNFICVEDARAYVELFADELKAAWDGNIASIKNRFNLRGSCSISRYAEDGSERSRQAWQPEDVKHAYGLAYVIVDDRDFLLVRPTRPRCEHLRRQVLNLAGVPEGEAGHFIVFRNCNIRRSVGGALMSLRDEAVYACDYRSPPDPESTKKYIDEPEKKQLERAPVRLPMFSGPAVPLPDIESPS